MNEYEFSHFQAGRSPDPSSPSPSPSPSDSIVVVNGWVEVDVVPRPLAGLTVRVVFVNVPFSVKNIVKTVVSTIPAVNKPRINPMMKKFGQQQQQ